MAYSCCVNQRCPSNKNQGDINHRHGTEGGRREGEIPSVYQLLLLPGGYVFTSVCLSVCLSVYLSIARISQKVWDQYRKFVKGLAIDRGSIH